MSKDVARSIRRPIQSRKSPTTSVLVRVWLEPDSDLSAPGSVRGYARDLRTGDERHFADAKKISSFLIERLDE